MTITQRNKPRLVVMNVEEYETLRRYADPRRAGLTAEMPDDLAEIVLETLEDYRHEGDN